MRDDRGVATVLMASILAGIMILVCAIAIAVDVVHTKSQAATAADLTALAAAEQVLLGDPCATAVAVAHRNNSELASCDIQGEDVQVEVKTAMTGALKLLFRSVRSRAPQVRAVSRAGPPDCDKAWKYLGIRC